MPSALTRPVAPLVALLMAGLLVLSGCTAGGGPDDTAADAGGQSGGQSGERAVAEQEAPPTPRPQVAVPSRAVTVLADAEAAALAVATSRALFEEAPLVVLAPGRDLDTQVQAASVAVHLGAPLLLHAAAGSRSGVEGELQRLEATTVLAFGDAPAAWARQRGGDIAVVAAAEDPEAVAQLAGLSEQRAIAAEHAVAAVSVLRRGAGALLHVPAPEAGGDDGTATPGPSTDSTDRTDSTDGSDGTDGSAGSADSADSAGVPAGSTPAPTARQPETEPASLPPHGAAEPVEGLQVLATHEPVGVAALATALAAGADPLILRDPDPRADPGVVDTLAGAPPERVLALGSFFGDADRLRRRLAVATTGVQLPGGGQVLFPFRRMVALYGHPEVSALGALGEQPLEAAIQRTLEVASAYQPHSDEQIVPTFEIIASIASAGAGEDGSYSSRTDVDVLRPWVERAGEAGFYVVLDLQPGRTDFLTQAQHYEELLELPHVGLALDPEWRLGPNQVHLRQIGSVRAGEVNEVVRWLADLTRTRRLPQKLLVLHQFKETMLPDRELIDTSRDELAVLIHMDGHGHPGLKLDSWRTLRADAPPGAWWGWKNFYDEDEPTMTPEQTMQVEPAPLFISYQ